MRRWNRLLKRQRRRRVLLLLLLLLLLHLFYMLCLLLLLQLWHVVHSVGSRHGRPHHWFCFFRLDVCRRRCRRLLPRRRPDCQQAW